MIKRTYPLLIIFVLFFMMLGDSSLARRQLGIMGQEAPEFGISGWIDGDGTPMGDIRLRDFRGKVVYLFLFQHWCPGCQSHGFPTLKEVSDNFANNDDVKFFAVQTVFEGHRANTPDKIVENQNQHGVSIPMCHDAGNPSTGNRSIVMSKYRAGGTPWTVIIDQDGEVVFNHFHINPRQAIAIINKLL